MKQPNWTASITKQLDSLKIPFNGNINTLKEEILNSLHTYRFALIHGIGKNNSDYNKIVDELLSIGNSLGNLLPQSSKGELFCDIQDFSDTDKDIDLRGHRSQGKMPFHSDPSDLMILHCLHPAKTGGENHIVNISSIHDYLNKNHSKLLKLLYKDYRRWKQSGVHGSPQEKPTSYKRPIFAKKNENISCVYNRNYINKGSFESKDSLTKKQMEALDLFDSLLVSKDFSVKIPLASSDTLILHNQSILHAREDYEDWAEPDKRRHLLRIWVDAPELFPVAKSHEFGDMFAPQDY